MYFISHPNRYPARPVSPSMAAKKEKRVGTVEHYFPHVQAAAVHLDGDLKVGDTIHIKGHSDDYTEKVKSIQVEHESVPAGRAGQSVGVWVPVKVHEHSEVYKVEGGGAPAPKVKPKVAKAKRTGRAKTSKTRKTKRAPKRARRKASSPTKRKSARRARKPKKARKAPKRRAAKKSTRKASKRRR
jgi:hypothetical protein